MSFATPPGSPVHWVFETPPGGTHPLPAHQVFPSLLPGDVAVGTTPLTIVQLIHNILHGAAPVITPQQAAPGPHILFPDFDDAGMLPPPAPIPTPTPATPTYGNLSERMEIINLPSPAGRAISDYDSSIAMESEFDNGRSSLDSLAGIINETATAIFTSNEDILQQTLEALRARQDEAMEEESNKRRRTV